MIGNLKINNSCIINVKEPEADFDVITKRYCDEKISSAYDFLKKDIISQVKHEESKMRNDMVRIHGDSMKGTLNMRCYKITGVNYPNSALDAINKKYLQIASMHDDAKIKNLMPICSILKDVLMKFENEHPNKY